jgi:hypothetical protein
MNVSPLSHATRYVSDPGPFATISARGAAAHERDSFIRSTSGALRPIGAGDEGFAALTRCGCGAGGAWGAASDMAGATSSGAGWITRSKKPDIPVRNVRARPAASWIAMPACWLAPHQTPVVDTSRTCSPARGKTTTCSDVPNVAMSCRRAGPHARMRLPSSPSRGGPLGLLMLGPPPLTCWCRQRASRVRRPPLKRGMSYRRLVHSNRAARRFSCAYPCSEARLARGSRHTGHRFQAAKSRAQQENSE